MLFFSVQDMKKRRTFNNFYTFCSFVLEYEEKLVSKLKLFSPHQIQWALDSLPLVSD